MNHNNSNFPCNIRPTALSRWSINTSIGILIATLSFNATAETTTHYYDGNTQHAIKLQSNLVAEFTNNASAQTRSIENTNTKRPFVTIRKNAPLASRAAGSATSQSPVFREGNSPAGRLMALPGGVIVNFKPDWTDDQVQLWAKAHSYVIKQKLNILGNWYVIDTPPGLISLQTANDIHETGEVISATPNWWKQTATR